MGSRNPFKDILSGRRAVSFRRRRATFILVQTPQPLYCGRNIALSPRGAIVDVGAGTGFVASGLRDAGFEVIAVEPQVDGTLIAHRRGLEHVVCGSFDDIGFAPSSIAAVGLFDVLEHIEDDIGTLARFRDD
jgi:2-polyprenyl-3-methyl-5-hydroxy-6-metoxy-1,4-benzoquinol methylase